MCYRSKILISACLAITLAASAGCGIATAKPSPVWIDTDPACGLGATYDVDDCWALYQASQSQSLDIRGISTVFGNATLDETHEVALRVIQRLNEESSSALLPLPVLGASRAGQVLPTPATHALADALQDSSLTIIALGPLTNVAALTRQRPDLIANIERIIAVAGQRQEQRFFIGNSRIMHMHDLNFRKDSNAAQVILDANIPLVLVPFEVAQQVIVTDAVLTSIETRNPSILWLTQDSRSWLRFWETALGEGGFYPFDSLAMLYMTNPRLFSCVQVSATIKRRRALFVESRDTLEVSDQDLQLSSVQYCHSIDIEPFEAGQLSLF